ncbi:tyrosine-type recombinase/integrase [Streptomyces sp. NPDC002755]
MREFLDVHDQRSTSATSHYDFGSILRRFTRRVKDCHVGTLRPEHCEDFFYGPGESLSSTCMHTTLATHKGRLKRFLAYCHRRGWLAFSPDTMLEDIRPKGRRNRNRYRMTLPELRELLDAADNPRDRALLAFVANTGVRISEATAMRVGDVSLARGELFVTLIKTNEETTLPMSSDLDRELRVWLSHYTEVVGKLERGYTLFPPYHPNRLIGPGKAAPKELNPTGKIAQARALLKPIAARAGIELESGDGWHTVRRSFARIVYEAAREHGHDDALRITQSALNHSRAETTERYLGLNLERQRYSDMMKGQPFLTADIDPGKIVALDERRASGG